MKASQPIAPAASGLLDHLAAHELEHSVDGAPLSLRARLPYPFEGMHMQETTGDANGIVPTTPHAVARRERTGDGEDSPTTLRSPTNRTPEAEKHSKTISTTHIQPEPAARPAPMESAVPAISAKLRSSESMRDVTTTKARIGELVGVLGAEPHHALTGTQRLHTPFESASHIEEPSKHHRDLPQQPASRVRDVTPVAATATLRPAFESARAPPLLPQAQSAREPTIEIHIGRLEVRAHHAPPQSAHSSRTTPVNDDRLAVYLSRRGRGARS